jgi:hypothetical protein
VEVLSICPFRGATLLWEPQPNQRSLTVCVKGTFALTHAAEPVLRPDQEAPSGDRHEEDSPLASLRSAGDHAPLRRRVDVTLVGHAYAPRGVPSKEVIARLRVGDLVKAVRVTGERRFRAGPRGVEASPAEPFVRLPIRYERAPMSPDNPVGVDPNAVRSIGGLAAPSLELVEGFGTPAFGPLAPTWRPRRAMLDDDALFWAYGVSAHGAPPAGPAPPNLDFGFFNAAPREQQLDLLRPGTPIVLENLSARHPLIATVVPQLRPQAFRQAPNGRAEEIALRCDALWIDPDNELFTLTWRGICDLDPRDAGDGNVVIAAESSGRRLRWLDVEALLGDVAPTVQKRPAAKLSPPLVAPPPVAPPVTLSLEDPLAHRYDSVKSSRGGTEIGALPAPPVDAIARKADPVSDATTQRRIAKRVVEVKLDPNDDRTQAVRTNVKLPALPFRPAPVPPPSSPRTSPPPRPRVPRPRDDDHDLTQEVRVPSAAPATPFEPRPATEPPPAITTAASDALIEIDDFATTQGNAGRVSSVSASLADDARDEALVASYERLRGPISAADYARIAVAIERCEAPRLLTTMQLDLPGLLRILRVWRKRVAESDGGALANEVARQVAYVREIT